MIPSQAGWRGKGPCVGHRLNHFRSVGFIAPSPRQQRFQLAIEQGTAREREEKVSSFGWVNVNTYWYLIHVQPFTWILIRFHRLSMEWLVWFLFYRWRMRKSAAQRQIIPSLAAGKCQSLDWNYQLSFHHIIRSPKKGWMVAEEGEEVELGGDTTNSERLSWKELLSEGTWAL